ncbi:cytochrome P450 [Bombardia bombarda]|uniref:Cytochrome P450 n=1 Tax=Bombardia bombarda TaxID=252184 RepID=A0AA39WUM8_9PEZI|nr:cytochrome P450 [Bombardia bombarda]
MNSVASSISWAHVAGAVVIYYASLAFYRLFLDPLARFPGPKLAAVSRWYEAYYDVVLNGQYTHRILEMHKEYGSPYELHVNDPSFFPHLYRQDGRWNKYAWAYDAQGLQGAIVVTADHDAHRARRQPLNPLYSKQKVASKLHIMYRNIDKLCARLDQLVSSDKTGDKKVVDVGASISAFARDVSTEFTLGKTYNALDKEDFGLGVTSVAQSSGAIWRVTKHVRWFGPLLVNMPLWLAMRISDEETKAFLNFIKENEDDTKRLMTAATTPDDKTPHTIVHEIMASSLPPSDKTPKRIFGDVATVTGAGFETTASVLRLILFHLYTNPDILHKLRAELGTIPASNPELKQLEHLPYLTAILTEGMRLSPAIGTRMARIAPDRSLVYGNWTIPAGTPVGMTTILMHTDEKLYPEPMRFIPERWVDPEERKKNEKTFAPFSRGTRNCLGMYVAWAELYLLVSALVYRYDFDFKDYATAKDFEMVSDQFIIGTLAKNVLNGIVYRR